MITFVFNKAGNLDQLPYFVLSIPHVRNSNSRNNWFAVRGGGQGI